MSQERQNIWHRCVNNPTSAQRCDLAKKKKKKKVEPGLTHSWKENEIHFVVCLFFLVVTLLRAVVGPSPRHPQ